MDHENLSQKNILHTLDNTSKNQSDNTNYYKTNLKLTIILLFHKHVTSEDKTVKKNYQYLLNPLLNFFAEKKKKIDINWPLRMQNIYLTILFFSSLVA